MLFAGGGNKMTVLLTHCVLVAVLLIGSLIMETRKKAIPEKTNLWETLLG